jgi:hypothetical protein
MLLPQGTCKCTVSACSCCMCRGELGCPSPSLQVGLACSTAAAPFCEGLGSMAAPHIKAWAPFLGCCCQGKVALGVCAIAAAGRSMFGQAYSSVAQLLRRVLHCMQYIWLRRPQRDVVACLLLCRLMTKAMWWTFCRTQMAARWGCWGGGHLRGVGVGVGVGAG